jgi:hypothetical protein
MSNAELELAWAAGFFDGEGSTKKIYSHYRTKKGEVRKPTKNVCVSVAQADLKPLLRFQKAVGNVGHINGPYSYRANQRPYWIWSASYKTAREVFGSLKTYLCSVKKAQYLRVTKGV